MLEEADLKYLLSRLKAINEGRYVKSIGICGNIANSVYSYQHLQGIFSILGIEEWEFYSGDPEHPVQSFSKKSPRECYEELDKWTKRSKYGRARWNLVDYLTKQIEGRLNEISSPKVS